MFATRQTGPVYTSVKVQPIRLLIFAAVVIVIGLAMTWGDKLWAIPIGIVLVLLGARLAYIAGRQLSRGVRTFLS